MVSSSQEQRGVEKPRIILGFKQRAAALYE
jgi:hypothetical protein